MSTSRSRGVSCSSSVRGSSGSVRAASGGERCRVEPLRLGEVAVVRLPARAARLDREAGRLSRRRQLEFGGVEGVHRFCRVSSHRGDTSSDSVDDLGERRLRFPPGRGSYWSAPRRLARQTAGMPRSASLSMPPGLQRGDVCVATPLRQDAEGALDRRRSQADSCERRRAGPYQRPVGARSFPHRRRPRRRLPRLPSSTSGRASRQLAG